MEEIDLGLKEEIHPYPVEIAAKAKTTFRHLQQTWREVGIPQVQRRDRFKVAMDHVLTLMSQLCEEEDGMKEQIVQSVKSANIQLSNLSKEMGVPEYQPDDDLTLLDLEEEMRRLVNDLTQQKQERLQRLKALQDEESLLANSLSVPRHPKPAGSVPTLAELQELQQNVDYLHTEKDRRFKAFVKAKSTILSFLADLELSPLSDFERDVVCEDDAAFVLSNDNLASLKDYKDELDKRCLRAEETIHQLKHKLKLLWERLDFPVDDQEDFLSENHGTKPKRIAKLQKEISRCESLKRANIVKFVEQLRDEVEQWQDRCFLAAEERKSFHPYMEDINFTEELLEVHEKEVTRLREFYEENKDILNNFTMREEVWKEMLEYEMRANDPDRFKNRGGNLLQEENRRKKIMRDLSRLDKELTVKVAEYEGRHGRPFLVDGHQLTQLIEERWIHYEQSKENEKVERQRARAKRVENEALNGTKASTPSVGNKNISKRKLPQQVTPSKQRKKPRTGTADASRVLRKLK